MALNRSLAGKTYPTATTTVTLEGLQKYACACNASNPAYFEASGAGGVVALPMFNAVVTWLALITALSDPELGVDLMRLVHRSHDIRFFAPIRAGDRISAAATIISIADDAAGEIVTIGLDASNQQEQTVSRAYFTALIRGRRQRDPSPPAASRETMNSSEPQIEVRQFIDPDQAVRYAEASGDRNPIHLDSSMARKAGLPGIIVQGLCTMAITANVIIEHLCAGNPLCLRRLAVTFSRPVFPGDTITTSVWREPERDGLRCYSYETVNGAHVAVIRDAVAEVM